MKRYIITDSPRTLQIVVFLFILITFPLFFAHSELQSNTDLRATAQNAPTNPAGGVVNAGQATIPVSPTISAASVQPTSPSFPPEGAYYPDISPWIFIIPGIIIFIGFFFY